MGGVVDKCLAILKSKGKLMEKKQKKVIHIKFERGFLDDLIQI